MPSFVLKNISGYDQSEETIEEAVDRIAKGARHNFDVVKKLLYSNLDDANIREIHADRITAGIIEAERIRIGQGSVFDEGYNPIEKLDTDDVGAMAFEDAVEYAMLGDTLIIGGYLQTVLINADYITAGTITGRTLRTAASGKRVEVNNDNTIKFYNANGHLSATIDAQAAAGAIPRLVIDAPNNTQIRGGSGIIDLTSNIIEISAGGVQAFVNEFAISTDNVYKGGFGSGNLIVKRSEVTHNHGGNTGVAGAHGHLGGGVGTGDQVWVRRGGTGDGEWVTFFAAGDHNHSISQFSI